MDYLFQSLDKNMEAFRSDWLPEVNATLKQFEEYFRKTREGIKQFKKTGSFIEVPEDIEGTVPHKDLSKNVKQERVTALMMPPPLKPVKRTRRQKIKTEKVSDDSENEGMERAESSHDLNLEVKQEVVRQSAQPFTRVTRGLSKRFIEQNKDDDCVIVTPHVETVNLNDSVDSSNCHSLSNKQSDQTAAGKTAENKPNDSVIKTKSVQSCESLPITRTTRTKTRQIQQKEENSKEQGANSSSQEIPKSTNEKDEERSRTKKTFIIQKPDIVESAQDVRCTRSRVRKQVEEQVVLNPPIEQVTSTNLKSAVSRIVDEVQDKRLRSPAVDDNAQAAKRSKISRMRLKLSSTDLVVGNENESNTCDQTFVVPNKNKEPTPPNSNLKEVNLVKKNKECWPAQGKLKSPPFVAAKFVQTKPKPVFNLYENSPVKKKVAAYEKLDEAKTFVFTAKQKRQQKLENIKPPTDTTPAAKSKETIEMGSTKPKPLMPSSSTNKNVNVKKIVVATPPAVTKSLLHFKESTQKQKQTDEKLRDLDEKLVKAQQSREMILKEKLKKTAKDRKPKFAKDQLQEIAEINEQKAMRDEAYAQEVYQKQKKEMAKKERSNKPIYLTEPLPLLPTEDCYDSDDDRAGHRKYIVPSWIKGKKRVLYYMDPDKISAGDFLFVDTEQTADLQELFKVVDPRKLKRTSSAVWHYPPNMQK